MEFAVNPAITATLVVLANSRTIHRVEFHIYQGRGGDLPVVKVVAVRAMPVEFSSSASGYLFFRVPTNRSFS